MPKEKAEPRWNKKSKLNSWIKAGFRTGKWNPEKYSVVDIWNSNPDCRKFKLKKFGDNIRNTAKEILVEGIGNNFDRKFNFHVNY